jgi:ankyrin repeat protein
LEVGADVNIINKVLLLHISSFISLASQNGNSALIVVADKGYTSIVRALLDYGADYDFTDKVIL